MTPETPPTPKFAIGDVVQLKSGGPLMTVHAVDSTTCDVMWIKNDGILQFDTETPMQCYRLADASL